MALLVSLCFLFMRLSSKYMESMCYVYVLPVITTGMLLFVIAFVVPISNHYRFLSSPCCFVCWCVLLFHLHVGGCMNVVLVNHFQIFAGKGSFKIHGEQ